jgi:homoserine O-acetyltransferase
MEKDFKNSVGLVETKKLKLSLPSEGFILESGAMLPEIEVAYETYGKLSEGKDNVIYICHALTGDAHVAGFNSSEDKKPGWWDAMVGHGKGIDTERFFVVCANILGGCKGTTGPSSINPLTGKPYGSQFPSITVVDIVKVQYLFLKQLGFSKLKAVVGGSFGGMQVLQWSISYPDMVETCICIASAMSLSAQALAFDIVGRNAILADPAWEGGDYYESLHKPSMGLAQARMIGHITYLSAENMKKKFGREKKEVEGPLPKFETAFQIESYLDYQGEKFVNRFDANSYLHITEAMDNFDLIEKAGGVDKVFLNTNPGTRFLVIALSSDWLFPAEQSLEVASSLVEADRHISYCLLKSPYGHDAFLVEVERLAEVIDAFLSACLSGKSTTSEQSAVEAASGTSIKKNDFDFIADIIEEGASILDLGCGDGSLMLELMLRKNARCAGMDINLDHVIEVIRKKMDILQCDLDEGLSLIPDKKYDYAILSQTLQVVKKPRFVLNELLRVAKEGIVSLPNFGNWRHRFRLSVSGRMPKSDSLPFEWYDTPNIHLSTYRDFVDLCNKEKIKIVEAVTTSRCLCDKALNFIGLKNIGADRIIVRIKR